VSSGGDGVLGVHVLADLSGIVPDVLRDVGRLEAVLRAAASSAGAIALGAHFHEFGGSAGVTGVLLLSESHMSVHTWPEHGFAAVDAFMCGTAAADRAIESVARDLNATVDGIRRVERGRPRFGE